MEKITSTNCWLYCVTLMLSVLPGVPAMPVDVDRVCMAPSTAKYRLSFAGKWSQTAFPKHYPLYRPPAQWSPIFGEKAHRNHNLFRIFNDCLPFILTQKPKYMCMCSPQPFTFLCRMLCPLLQFMGGLLSKYSLWLLLLLLIGNIRKTQTLSLYYSIYSTNIAQRCSHNFFCLAGRELPRNNLQCARRAARDAMCLANFL